MDTVLHAPAIMPRLSSRLRTTGLKQQDLRVERVLAVSRLLLALTSLTAWLIYLGGIATHHGVALFLLLAYSVASLALLVRLEMGGEPSPSFVVAAQVNDVAWPALLCLFAAAPNSVFFMLFLFAIIAAAFRWGFVETMTTALVCAALLFLQAIAEARGPSLLHNLFLTPVAPAQLFTRCGFVVLAGGLLGFLAETEKELRAEIALTNRLLSLAQVGNRFAGVLQNILLELAQVFEGGLVCEVVAQSSTGRAFRWEVPPSTHPSIQLKEIAPADQNTEIMRDYPHTFFLKRDTKTGRGSITALDEEGRRLETGQVKHLEMPVPGAASILVISHEMGRDWYGRFILLNAKLGFQREHELRFAQNVMRQLAPAIYSVYLFQAFRSRAGVTERARVARELHDTAIQSLISIEMQVDVLRRRASDDSQLTSELARIQDLLRLEVLNLRELMQTMRPIDIGPHQFLDFIAELVERFSRDTGIAVRFISELQEVTLPAATCRELVRMVQESLVNIRKHSGARSAVVRFGSQDGLWKLVINDDGNGFPFAGRFALRELDSLRRGPAVIKERVRAVGGDMTIESTPGHGSRLEITIPQKGYETYG
ncbi:MAG: histidine kinase [Candidatus Korobacteraceae bacterium]